MIVEIKCGKRSRPNLISDIELSGIYYGAILSGEDDLTIVIDRSKGQVFLDGNDELIDMFDDWVLDGMIKSYTIRYR